MFLEDFVPAEDAIYNAEHSTYLGKMINKCIKKASNKGYRGVIINVEKFDSAIINDVFDKLNEAGYFVALSAARLRIEWRVPEKLVTELHDANNSDLYIENNL